MAQINTKKGVSKMKKGISLILGIILVLSLAACGSDSATESAETSQEAATFTKEDLGTVYVGIDGAYPPYCFLNENDEVDGFEVAIMKEIAERNDIEIECQVTAWNSMFGQLDSGRIDTVAESISITSERQEKYDFSKSYIESSNRFLVREGEESSITSFEDLAGKKIGVAAGQLAYQQLVAIQDEYDVEFEIVPYESSTNAYDVSIGRLDASYMSPVAGMEMSNEGDLGLAVADCPAYERELCAYAFVKDSPRAEFLCGMFSDTLEEMKEDGTLSELCKEWLGADVSVVE